MKDDQSKPSGRAKGGLARKESLSPERRSEIARKAALARHTAARPLEAIRKGNFKEQFGFDSECYVLNDAKKTAVMSQRGIAAALGLSSSSGTALKSFVQSRSISSTSVGADILEKLANPLIFKDSTVGGGIGQPRPVHGLDVTLLMDICNAIIEAKIAGTLAPSQLRLAQNAAILLSASSKAGIQGLVYALAGYRPEVEEVIEAFKAFVQEEARKYEKEFPTELYLEWARLYSITAPIRGRSWKHRHLTIDHVYYPLAKSNGSLLAMLKESRESDGGGKKLFQFLNEVGTRALRMHLGRVLEMAESSQTLHEYEAKISERFGGQKRLDLD
ncbi:P63C domain-containing protein [Curvibacter sp. HBC28]|uniref:P63C domain-containing protein n=1 Tax=Curvibacter microcysteis TaxID=3026419 RepID=A0ABT5MCK3_9BURK|nr:P63C domain-containing protein [Curvibacter sp. HBC28]MDD0814301.1 P63C domain-containing protein [Curvibacter sp. HBC28]